MRSTIAPLTLAALVGCATPLPPLATASDASLDAPRGGDTGTIIVAPDAAQSGVDGGIVTNDGAVTERDALVVGDGAMPSLDAFAPLPDAGNTFDDAGTTFDDVGF